MRAPGPNHPARRGFLDDPQRVSFLDQIRNRIVGGVRVFADTVRPSSVAGFCPSCGARSLRLEGGKLVCREPGCPAPDTAARLLTDREVYHRVDFAADGFTIRHPLHERIGDALLSCPLHTYCAGLDTPPRIGLHRAFAHPDGVWTFVPVR